VGSARSAGGYNIVEGIFRCADLLTEFGGHADAAGFTVPQANYPALRDRLTADAALRLSPEDLKPCLDLDAVLPPQAITKQTVCELSAFEPFGRQNEPPRFAATGCRVARVDAVGQGAHLKMQIEAGATRCDAIWWRRGELVYELGPGAPVDVAFGLELNAWNGETRLQMVVEDMRSCGPAGKA
jgi:single-stranded-DNA-specific exonuclease